MAKKITCDKCNREIANEKPKTSIQIKAAGSIYTQHSDLCDECLSKLIDVLKEFGEVNHEFTPDCLKKLSAEIDKQRQEIPRYMNPRFLDANGMSLIK